jgi:predicted PurR-regulated permease PerM
MKGKFALAFEKREHRLAALHTMREIEADLGAYLVTATAINVGLGICATIVLYLIGVPNAYLWGLMATVLNFIPYIGPAIMLVVLFVVGLVTFPSLGYAVLPPAAFLCLTTVEGQYLTPTIIGRRLELNPFLLFLGVAFWTWLWGPFGAFLSVPILIICMVVARLYFPEEAPMQLP